MTPAGAPVAPVETLMASARQRTGIDIVDQEAVVPLTMLVKTLNEESHLHPAGARGMQDKLVRILGNRLRMQRDFLAHPEIADERIEAPVFVCGMGRTGSTKMQKMLAASGDFNWLPYWQVTNPSLFTGDPSESTQPRIEETEAFVRWFDAASPETKFGHAFETFEPEEESFILEHSLRTPTFLGWAPLDGFLGWLTRQDMTAQFIHLRDTLKYLQWQGLTDRANRWVLKSPLYSGLETLLLRVFPDAKLVMTHRQPRSMIPSSMRLLECFYKPFTDSPPDPNSYISGLSAAIGVHLHNRAQLPKDTFCDIDFRELCSDAQASAARAYRFAGVGLTPRAQQRMLDWNAANPQHRRGKHDYDLARYGLSAEAIERPFAHYIRFLEERFG